MVSGVTLGECKLSSAVGLRQFLPRTVRCVTVPRTAYQSEGARARAPPYK